MSRLVGADGLLPSPDEGRELLRRELLHREYQDGDVLGRLERWLEGLIDSGFDRVSSIPTLQVVAVLVILLALSVAVLLLAGRARRSRTMRPAQVLEAGSAGLSAAE
ncbi:MAG: hypothetical protein QM572_12890, partial [Nocardioides sp.]|uniref:hypothetical protein n=1 Tax=Nocardioides sp. TaxID=35761 RepID=UPI0039E44AE1